MERIFKFTPGSHPPADVHSLAQILENLHSIRSLKTCEFKRTQIGPPPIWEMQIKYTDGEKWIQEVVIDSLADAQIRFLEVDGVWRVSILALQVPLINRLIQVANNNVSLEKIEMEWKP